MFPIEMRCHPGLPGTERRNQVLSRQRVGPHFALSNAMAAMRIEVLGEDTISAQARTYAEYRVFAALARSAEKVRRTRVVLRALDRCGGCGGVACIVTVALKGTGSIRIRTTGAHAYAAINRAVERIQSAAASRFKSFA
jgi:ribosome-associated translation inhibitor RaiA